MFWDKRSDGDKYFGISKKKREALNQKWAPLREMFEQWILHRNTDTKIKGA